MQSVKGAQFLNTTFLPTFSGCAGASTRVIDIVPLTGIYASLKSHKFELNVDVYLFAVLPNAFIIF